MNPLIVPTLLETASKIASVAKMGAEMQNSSLPEYMSSTRLAPVVLVDRRVLAADQDQLTALMQTLLSIYSGYYLSAVSAAVNVGNVQVMRLLDRFATERSVGQAAMNSKWLGNEAIDDTKAYLPRYGMESSGYEFGSHVGARPEPAPSAMDMSRLGKHSHSFIHVPGEDKEVMVGRAHEIGNTIDNIVDESNLAVGKILDVKISSGNQSTTVPVTVTLVPKSIDSEDLITIAKSTSIDKSARGRWHQWRSGEIRFIKDYLLVNDIIDADRKAMVADKTGFLLSARTKETKATMATLASGYGSPNSVSAMCIISKQTATELELVLRGSLKSTHVRSEFFKNNSLMMLIVVDLRMERFTLYQRGIADFGEYTMADIKGNGKKPNGVDINGVLRAYQLGAATSL